MFQRESELFVVCRIIVGTDRLRPGVAHGVSLPAPRSVAGQPPYPPGSVPARPLRLHWRDLGRGPGAGPEQAVAPVSETGKEEEESRHGFSAESGQHQGEKTHVQLE